MGDTARDVAVVAMFAIGPVLLVMLTSFVKLSVVLGLVRNALGSPQVPPGLVVTGLALVLTLFVMSPVIEQVVDAIAPHAGGSTPGPGGGAGAPAPDAPGPDAPTPGAPALPGEAGPGGDETPPPATPAAPTPSATPDPAAAADPFGLADRQWPADGGGWLVAAGRAAEPVRAFLVRHAHARDRATFAALAGKLRGRAQPAADDSLGVLAPAFVTSELKEAFAIGFLLLLPFLVIDLVVGMSLGALGLVQTSPAVVSLPLKLLLFVAVDGWRLLVEGLVLGYS